jgi:hypothetical protein
VVVKVMDEVFIPVGEIVNGATIAREPPAEVTYWQVELESHDVILSEGLKTESGLGARDWFAGGEGSPDPEPTPEIVSGYARPLVAGGPVIAAVRQRLIARAEALGWTRGEDMDLHLLIDDQRCEADIDGDLARFLFPASAESAIIASRVFVPAWRIGDYDERELGVSISGLNISDGLRVDREIALDDAVLGEGFHGPEGSGERKWRWTRGGGVLPKALWEGCRGQVILRLGFDPHGGWSWQAPRGGETDVPADSKPVTLRVVSQRRKR